MMKARRWKLTTFWLTLVFSLFVFTGCFGFQKKLELKEVQAPQLYTVYNDELQWYDVYVEGIIENISDDTVCINLTVVLYDADGNVLEVAYAYMGEVGAGERWRYCATASSVIEPTACRISEMYGYKCYKY